MEKNRLEFKRPCQDIDVASLEKLIEYEWPGNIRELKNIIERAMILSQSTVLTIEENQIPSASCRPPSASTRGWPSRGSC